MKHSLEQTLCTFGGAETRPSLGARCLHHRSNFEDRFKGLYRRDSDRLRGWDYRTPAAYFVTICTAGRRSFFGHIIDGKMISSTLGKPARHLLLAIPSHNPHVRLDAFVLMPNHLHAVLLLSEFVPGEETRSTKHMAAISPKAGSLGVVVRSYKAAVTRWVEQRGHLPFGWQRGYYDHIIRDGHDLERIRGYIRDNPAQWTLDRYHSDP